MIPLTFRRGPRASSTFSGPLSTVQYDVNGVRFDMVRVPPGRFIDGEGSARRELLVSRPFEIGIAPVTQALWRAVMGSSPSRFPGEDRPVEQVSWGDAQDLMVVLAARGLPGFRLPTEAEWAWAARCGVPTRWAGSERADEVAMADAMQAGVVAGLWGSAVGAFDFSGNVWEWMSDWHGAPSAGVDLWGPASAIIRVSRGGGWRSELRCSRIAVRGSFTPGSRGSTIGVRLLRAVP